MTANNKTVDARACAKKYFREASVDIKLLDSFIRGINDNKLISNPIHALNHEFEEIVNNVPIIRIDKNKILEEFLKIKKKRSITFMSGV